MGKERNSRTRTALAARGKKTSAGKTVSVKPQKKPATGKPMTHQTKPAPARSAGHGAPVKATIERRALTKAERDQFRGLLMAMKERLTGQVASLKGDSLKREDGVNSAEDGTDAFERQFALTIASAENQNLVEIDEAIQRLADGTYGTCEECECPIEIPRLRALPFVRKCVGCQSKTENGRTRFVPSAALEQI